MNTFSISSFNKYLRDTDLYFFSDIIKLIDFETKNFSSWENTIEQKRKKLQKDQQILQSKTSPLTEYDEYVLSLDINDFLDSKDEDMISFKQEVLEMLIVKLYAKSEKLLKSFFTLSDDRNASGLVNAGANIIEWKRNYILKLSINLERLRNYNLFNELRILNNSIKHYDGFFSVKLAKDIFKTSAFSVFPYFFDLDFCSKISSITNEEDFLKTTERSSSHLKLQDTDLKKLHAGVLDFFTDLNSKL